MALFRTSGNITPYLLFLVGITVLGPLQFGYHLAELNAPSTVLRCRKLNTISSSRAYSYFKKPSNSHGLPQCIPMSPGEFALVSSIFTLGGFLGALSAGPFSAWKGRLLPMRLCFPFFLFGSIMEALAPSIPVIAVGRFLSGVGAGACMVVGPVYVSEIAPVVVKGTLGASTQVAINIGILLAQVLGYFLSYGSKWRIILGVGGGIAVLHFLGLLSGVESPEWLGSKGETTAARQALHKIRSGQLAADEERKWGASRDGEGEHTGRPNPPAPTDEATEHTSLLTPPRSPASSTGSGTHKERESVGMFAVLRHPDHQRAIVAVIAVMLAQQLCGINSVMMYSVSFLSELLPTGAALITVAVGALNVVVTLACAPLADRLGRKRCLLLSIAGMGSMSFLLAFGIMYRVPALTGAATLAFVAAFAVGLGPVPFILASELVGPEAVGATQSWALASNWLATFVVAQFFPMLNDAMGRGRVFFVFTALAVVFFSFIAWWVPESRGKANADEVWGRTDRRED